MQPNRCFGSMGSLLLWEAADVFGTVDTPRYPGETGEKRAEDLLLCSFYLLGCESNSGPIGMLTPTDWMLVWNLGLGSGFVQFYRI